MAVRSPRCAEERIDDVGRVEAEGASAEHEAVPEGERRDHADDHRDDHREDQVGIRVGLRCDPGAVQTITMSSTEIPMTIPA